MAADDRDLGTLVQGPNEMTELNLVEPIKVKVGKKALGSAAI
jgi:hypothetical protein